MHHPVRKIFTDGPRTGTRSGTGTTSALDLDLTAQVQQATERSWILRVIAFPTLGADTILEAGCGSGWVVAWLGLLGHAVIGLDFALAPLHRAKVGADGLCPWW